MNLQLIRLRWLDHTLHVGEHEESNGLTLIETVGYLVAEDRKLVRVAMSWNHQTKRFHEVLVVDRRTIEGEIEYLSARRRQPA